MARAKRKLSAEFPLHITARNTNRDWFDLPKEEVWKVFEDYLYLAKPMFGIKIHSFVLMTNHYHMLVSDPEMKLPKFMHYFQTGSSIEMTRLSGRINQTYGQRYFSSIIGSYHYYCLAYRYLYRNPVDAGLVHFAEEYKFSTLSGLLGFNKQILPLEEDTLLFGDVHQTLRWINTEYKKGEREIFRKALRKTVFRLPREETSRRANRFEVDLV
jgi:REP element-mobilizing transposase RayT